MTRPRATTVCTLAVLALGAILLTAVSAGAAVPKRIVFPAVGSAAYTNDYGAPRAGGGHQGNDIMTDWRAIAVAAESGSVKLWTSSSRAGCMLYLYGDSGTTYLYIHLNNDLTPRTADDGGCIEGVAYAPGLRDGRRVSAGQHLGFIGDSGNAENGVNHLHFEIHPNGNCCVSPYKWLNRAQRLLFPIPLVGAPAITYRLRGTVNRTRAVAGGSMLAIITDDLRGSDGSSYAVRKRLVVWVPDAAIVKKKVKRKRRNATLVQARKGQKVTVWSIPTKPTLEAAKAKKNQIIARKILLRR